MDNPNINSTLFFSALEEGKRRPYYSNIKPIPTKIWFTSLWFKIVSMTEKFKNKIYEVEHQLHISKAQKNDYYKEIKELIDYFDSELEKLDCILTNKELSNLCWGYIFREIFPILIKSNFFKRVYFKPKGYPGDFLMMEAIYKNMPNGDGLLGKLIDKYFLNAPAARAVRERRRMLSKLLFDYSSKITENLDNEEKLKIMNLACGSNRELFDFLSQFEKTVDIECTCIDADNDALFYTQNSVDIFEHNASIQLINDNVIKWAIKRKAPPNCYDQHIIYSSGLTDYLNDKLFIAFVKLCYDLLRPGGRVIISNYSINNPNKAWMDHIFMWRLIHRTEKDMKQLLMKGGFTQQIQTIHDKEKVNLIVTAIKEVSF